MVVFFAYWFVAGGTGDISDNFYFVRIVIFCPDRIVRPEKRYDISAKSDGNVPRAGVVGNYKFCK
jgi:hypothetical protein